jgi:G3E family GTPase
VAAIPVTLITGFLGAGKTTLVNELLRTPPQRRLGVLVNELGDVGIDGELMGEEAEGVVELTSGCLCCSVRGELSDSLTLMTRVEPPLDGIVVETTGLADPGPVIDTVAWLPDQLRLDALVTVADARTCLRLLDDPELGEARRQVELASTIVISKSDLVDGDALEAARGRLRALNPLAELHLGAREAAGHVLASGAFDASRAETVSPDHDDHDDHGDHDHHDHAAVDTVSVEQAGELDPERLDQWLMTLRFFDSSQLHRLKAVLAVAGEERRFVIHGVQGYLDTAHGRPWGDNPRVSRLVAIGRDLDEQMWTSGLRGCAASED